MSRFFSGLLAGIAGAVLVLVLVVVIAVKFGYVPARADVPPPAIEKTMAHVSLDATIEREQPRPPYPFANSDAMMIAGAKLYDQNCAMCHGKGSGDPTTFSRGLYVQAPQFVKHGVDDDPEGETYWKIEHGIRFTAMPFYRGHLTEEQIWQMTYFLKNLPDHLPPEALALWKQPLSADAR